MSEEKRCTTNGKNIFSFQNNAVLKRSNSNQEEFNGSAKKICLFNKFDSRNEMWSRNCVRICEVNPVIKYSVNNRLMNAKDRLEASKSIEASTENLVDPVISILIQQFLQMCISDSPKNSTVLSKIGSKLNYQDNKCIGETLSISKSNIPSTHQLLSQINSSTPVNIYKNLSKWLPKGNFPNLHGNIYFTNKSDKTKQNLANDRYKSLRKYINSAEEDNQHSTNKINKSTKRNLANERYRSLQKYIKNVEEDNLYVTNKSDTSLKKNLANERYQNLRKYFNKDENKLPKTNNYLITQNALVN